MMRRQITRLVARRCPSRAGSSSPIVTGARQSGLRSRAGLTLLEVLLSTAIFMGALTAIMQLMRIGHDSRLSARLDAEAALRCESLMAELVSGIRPLTPESNAPFEGEENWTYSVNVEAGDGESLLLVSARVDHAVSERLPNSSFQLVRLMRDPQMFLDAAMSASTSEDD